MGLARGKAGSLEVTKLLRTRIPARPQCNQSAEFVPLHRLPPRRAKSRVQIPVRQARRTEARPHRVHIDTVTRNFPPLREEGEKTSFGRGVVVSRYARPPSRRDLFVFIRVYLWLNA